MKLFVETDADSRLAKRVLKVRKNFPVHSAPKPVQYPVCVYGTMSASLNTSLGTYSVPLVSGFYEGQAVLRIRDVYPIFFHPGSQMQGTRSRIRIRVKEFKYF
jgi:hypothetical protein